jgi:hypothetical protein
MPTYTLTERQFQNYLRSRPRKIEDALRKAETENARDGVRIAQKQSSGPYSQAQLTAADHPYATRRRNRVTKSGKQITMGIAGYPLDVVNFQTGEFFSRWQYSGPWNFGGMLTTRILNDSRVAHWLDAGTKFMVARSFRKTILKQLKERRRKRVYKALVKALTPP